MSSTNIGEDKASPTLSSFEQEIEIVKAYHQATKHRFEGFARGPETLDWDNQPNPFRYFDQSPIIPLSLEPNVDALSYSAIIQNLKNTSPQPINHATLSAFFRTSFGLAAWKQYGPDTWALRVNPSSGNLHPTEVYCLLNTDETHDGVPLNGLMHYQAHEHALEVRGTAPSLSQLGEGFLLVFTSVLWRESWKYGERAYRYCQLDMGHALSCAEFAAKSLGWRSYLLPRVPAATMSQSLGLANDEYKTIRSEEGEVAECCVYISPSELDCSKGDKSLALNDEVISALSQIDQWFGVPNPLGEKTFYKWPKINQVAAACDLKSPSVIEQLAPVLPVQDAQSLTDEKLVLADDTQSFKQLVLKRRSAQRFEQKPLSKAVFTRIVSQLLIAKQPLLTGLQPELGRMHFVMIVHNVDDMEPGLYVLPSDSGETSGLQAAVSQWPDWDAAEQLQLGGETHTLYRLKNALFRKVAGALCCQQSIAVDCNFTVGYLARFEQLLNQIGSFGYRSLYWQAGSIAQQVYLAATHEGIAATGIGCYFDDPCHELLGLENQDYQMMYQMAVGHPIVDERIANFSGYYHLKERS